MEFRTVFRTVALVAAGGLLVPSGALAQGPCEDAVTVERGQTLSRIAAECDVSLDAILDANPGIGNPNVIFVGQKIEIPGDATSTDPQPEPVSRPDETARDASTHTVKAGETLGRIAAQFGTTVAALLDANPIIHDPNVIEIGWTLRIPGEARGQPAPPEEPEHADPKISISPQHGPDGTSVRVQGSHFPPNERVHVGLGLPDSEFRVIAHARTDNAGNVDERVALPAWTRPDRDYVFVLATEDYRVKAISGRFDVTPADERGPEPDPDPAPTVTLEGTIEEGVECPALRTDDGKLYTLAGDLHGHTIGDRVSVKGQIAEMSTCMQGTTVTVHRIDSAEPSRGDDDNLEKVLRVEGRLTDDGVECQALRADDGTLYTLVGKLDGFSAGDRVYVEGTKADVSICMQGTTLEVKHIERR